MTTLSNMIKSVSQKGEKRYYNLKNNIPPHPHPKSAALNGIIKILTGIQHSAKKKEKKKKKKK